MKAWIKEPFHPRFCFLIVLHFQLYNLIKHKCENPYNFLILNAHVEIDGLDSFSQPKKKCKQSKPHLKFPQKKVFTHNQHFSLFLSLKHAPTAEQTREQCLLKFNLSSTPRARCPSTPEISGEIISVRCGTCIDFEIPSGRASTCFTKLALEFGNYPFGWKICPAWNVDP